jgi:hypothetical protein
MKMMVRYPSGRMAEGVLLAANHNVMRVVLRHSDETTEFRLYGNQWVSDTGDALEIESVLTNV